MGCTNCYSGDMWWVLVWVGLKGFVMGRVIKFRGYDEENKTWRYGFYYKGTNGGARIASYIIADDGLMYYIHSEKSIGQFTGLTDKNGVDIYEGDILSFHVDWAEQPNKEVVFDDEFHSYVLLSGIEKEWVAKGSNHYKYWTTDEDNIYLLHQAESYDCEVIGNIHQSPELLK